MNKYEDGGEQDPEFPLYKPKDTVILDIKDSRKTDPITGKPITDRNRRSVKVNQDYIKDIIGQAKSAGIDPYTALAVSYQESGFANGDKLYNLNPEVFGKSFGNAEEGMKSLQDMMKWSKGLQDRGKIPQGEQYLLQGNNGYGIIKRGHADLEGANSIYGVPIPDQGINFKKNPYYGKTIMSLRDEILKNNQQINDLVNNTPAVMKKKYADGGEIDNSIVSDPDKPGSKTQPLTPTQVLKQKYSSNPYLVDPTGKNNRYFWATQTNREFPLSGGNVKDAVVNAAKSNKIDPALLYASAMEEGMSGAIDNKNYENASQAYVMWSEKNSDKAEKYPVDSFYNYGLDQFAGNAPGLIKKGYLPKDFQNNFTTFDIENEKREKGKGSAFNTDANALLAKSAMMRMSQDQLDSYSKSKNYNLTPEQKDFFLLANYNGGEGNMQKMLDSYNQKGYLKDNKFLDPSFKPDSYQGIYSNVQARIQSAKMLRDEHTFKYGGTMPKPIKGVPKYEEGTPDPITGGTNNWTNTNTQETPKNPFTSDIIPLENQPGSPVNQGKIKPLSQFFDSVDNGNNINLNASGKYVDALGNTTTSQDQQMLADNISNQNRQRANTREDKMNDLESISATSIAAINSFFERNQKMQNDRATKRQGIMQQMNANAQNINPYAEGTGSQAIMKHGGTIHINPANKGKFNALKKSTGKSTEELTHSKNALTRKRAIFAQNAKKWHHGEFGMYMEKDNGVDNHQNYFKEGGEIDGNDLGIQSIDGGGSKMISSSDHSNPMVKFQGRTHDEGGIGLKYGGNVAEVEDKEIGWVDQNGGLNIFGKLRLPGTNQTFRKTAEDIADQEKKVDGLKAKYLNILNNSDSANPYHESAQATAKVMFKSLDKQSKQIADKKEALSSYQNLILNMTDQGMKMKYGGEIPKYEDGGQTGPGDDDEISRIAKAIAKVESNSNYSSIGVPVTKGQYKGQRALGKYQVMEDNAKQWYKEMTGKDITVADFIKDSKIQDEVAKFAMNRIYQQHKNPADVASVWFTGRPTSDKSASSAKDDNGTNGNQYVNAVMKAYNSSGGKSYTNNSAGTDSSSNNSINNPTNNTNKVSPLNKTEFAPSYIPITDEKSVDTPYGKAKREAVPLSDKVTITNSSRERGNLSPLAIEQIAPELTSLATNKRINVPELSYQSDLQSTFDVSYQLGRNENQSTFNQTQALAEQTGNMDILSQLAAQKYKADQAYNMQEVQGNAQQKQQVYAQNTATLNDAKLKNLSLIADQQGKQAQADFNTKIQDMQAYKSISAKTLQNELENKTYNAYANLFKNYGFDSKGNVTFEPDKVARKFNSAEAQQFGLMSAQQGAQSIMNGDFSRQFTKVKNSDGSTTTTENYGTNKKIQDEYKTLKNQGFDDNLIGNMLRAKYPEIIAQD